MFLFNVVLHLCKLKFHCSHICHRGSHPVKKTFFCPHICSVAGGFTLSLNSCELFWIVSSWPIIRKSLHTPLLHTTANCTRPWLHTATLLSLQSRCIQTAVNIAHHLDQCVSRGLVAVSGAHKWSDFNGCVYSPKTGPGSACAPKSFV